MKIPSLIIMALLFSQLTSCSKAKDKYVFITSYIDNTNRVSRDHFNAKINNDSLYLFFEEGFNSDTLSIEVGKDFRTSYPATSANGDAEVQVFGKMKDISEFKISINGNKKHRIEIRDQWMNKWAVSIRRDTIWITVLNNAPFYD